MKQQNSFWSRGFASAQLAFNLQKAALLRDRTGWCFGIITITLVVAFITILVDGIAISPVIFLKLSEDQSGETDLSITSKITSFNSLPFVNWTAINIALTSPGSAPAAFVKGTSPRWILLSSIYSPNTPSVSANAIVLVYDSIQEKTIGLGRAWTRRSLGPSECYVSTSALSQVNVQGDVGDQIVVDFNIPRILGYAASVAGGQGGTLGNGNITQQNALILNALLQQNGVNGTVVTLTNVQFFALQVALLNAGINIPTSSLGTPIPGTTNYQVNSNIILATIAASSVNVLNIQNTYTVLDGVSSPGGKYPPLLGNVVMLEAKHFAVFLRNALLANLNTITTVLNPILAVLGVASPAAQNISNSVAILRSSISTFNYDQMKEFAMQTAVMMSNRNDVYLQSNPKVVDAAVNAWMATSGSALGISYPFSISTTLADTLSGINVIALFLSQIFYVTVFVLTLLGSLTIYALILGDVSERTYELSMLRALGFKNAALGSLLVFQTAAFAIPALIIGLIIAALLSVGIAYGVGWFASLNISYWMPISAWAIGISVGVAIPTIATVLPIQNALSTTLRDGLDLSHSAANAVTVQMRRLSDIGVSPLYSTLGIVLVLIGFTTFYLLPLAFIFQDLAWFLGVLTAILMGMLLGLALVAQSLQPYLEKLVLRFVLLVGSCSRDMNMLTVISKNLSGHRSRNVKTTAILALATSFLIFASSMFALQASLISTNLKMFLGSDIVALVPVVNSGPASTDALPQTDIDAVLTSISASTSIVAGWSWVSTPINFFPFVRRTQISNLVGLPLSTTRIYGVQRNYLDVAFGEYTFVTDGTDSGVPSGQGSVYNDPIKQMYDGADSLKLPIETSLTAPPSPIGTGPTAASLFICNMSVPTVDFANAQWTIVPDDLPCFINANVSYAPLSFYTSSFLASLNQSTYVPPGYLPAYLSYDYCVVACNMVTQTLGNRSSTMFTMIDARNITNSSNYQYPFYGQQVTYPPFSSSAQYFYSSPQAIGYAQTPCIESSSFDAGRLQDTINQAYSGYVDVIIAEAYRSSSSLTIQTPLKVRVTTRDSTTGYYSIRAYIGKARAMVKKMSGFLFSSYASLASSSPLLVRMEDHLRLLNDAKKDLNSILISEGRVPSFASIGSASSSKPSIDPSLQTLGSVPAWKNSSIAWVYSTSPTVPNRTYAPIFDLNPSTVATVPLSNSSTLNQTSSSFSKSKKEVGVFYLTLDLGVCVVFSGASIGLSPSALTGIDPRSVALSASVEVYALADVAASGYRLLTSLSIAGPANTNSTSINTFSSRYFGLLIRPTNPSPTFSSTVVPDLLAFQLTKLAPGLACDGDGVSSDDSYPSTPKQRLLVRLRPGASEADRTLVLNGIRSAITSDTVQVQDVQSLLASTQTAQLGLDIFFYFVAIICLVLVFFSSYLSFQANFKENVVEFGILRSLGLSGQEATRAFVWEALTVVLTAYLLGAVVGLAIAISLTVQFGLFTEMPFTFAFPYGLFFFTLLACILIALVSSYLPARKVAKVQIATVLKG
jgi:ABC-type antimicrobial peptide transport system permease subunit